MRLKEHKNLTLEKWTAFPFYKQILNIACELQRANSWIKRKDFEEVNNCYARALELIYLRVECLLLKKEKN